MNKLIRNIITYFKVRTIRRCLLEVEYQMMFFEIPYEEAVRKIEILEKELAELQKD